MENNVFYRYTVVTGNLMIFEFLRRLGALLDEGVILQYQKDGIYLTAKEASKGTDASSD